MVKVFICKNIGVLGFGFVWFDLMFEGLIGVGEVTIYGLVFVLKDLV